MTTPTTMKQMQEHLNNLRAEKAFPADRVICNDGFSMSVQGHSFSYCRPRVDGLSDYSSFEIGFPSADEDLITSLAEDQTRLTNTVYGYVDADIVLAVINKHGGFAQEKTNA